MTPTLDSPNQRAYRGGISRLLESFRLRRERRRRGAREFKRLQRSDAVLVSPGNSGRTWLRAMLTRAFERHFNLDDPPILSFDNLHKQDSRIPIICITHNRWLPYYQRDKKTGQGCSAYYNSRVLVLVRNPIDTCISQYFQWLHRSKDFNIALKGWPSRNSGLSMLDFLQHPTTGIDRLCEELNLWLLESPRFRDTTFLRYEDMIIEPATCLESALNFYGVYPPAEIIREAVDHCAFDNMRKRESSSGPLIPGSVDSSRSGSNTFKARRGAIAGYDHYLPQEQREHFEALVATALDPAYGYAKLPVIQQMLR